MISPPRFERPALAKNAAPRPSQLVVSRQSQQVRAPGADGLRSEEPPASGSAVHRGGVPRPRLAGVRTASLLLVRCRLRRARPGR